MDNTLHARVPPALYRILVIPTPYIRLFIKSTQYRWRKICHFDIYTFCFIRKLIQSAISAKNCWATCFYFYCKLSVGIISM